MSSFISVLLVSLLQNLHSLDIGLLRAIYENRNPIFDSFFILITNSAAALAFGIPAILFFTALYRKEKTLRRNALNIFIIVALSAIVSNILKYAIDLPRPYEIYPFILKLSSGGSPSFPSGHTADAFAFAVAAGILFRKWFIIIPALSWAIVVGYSRMNLGVHYPSDVLGGAIIGATCAVVYIWVEKRKQAKYPK